MSTLLEKFLRYVKIDTQSDPNSLTYPSTEKQKNLAKLLVSELQNMGLEAHMDEYSYVYSKLPKNTTKKGHVIGLIAHLDTSSDAPGNNVKPRVINNYDGGLIRLNEFYQMSPKTYPSLSSVIGDDLIVTDGNTLLGADDKAGVAEIMQAVQEILLDNSFEHDDIYICFTPDEEIGRGVDKFNYNIFPVDFAYTLDGGQVGSIEYENFNAASAKISVTGKSIHPGDAKDKMINASKLIMEFNSLLPVKVAPEHTQNYEGFFHITNMEGSVETGILEYIIRDHDFDLFTQKKIFLEDITKKLNDKYQYEAFKIEIKDQYYNMKSHFVGKEYIIDLAVSAIKKEGLKPSSNPIRGGTDGAMLTYHGLPCPNLGTGGYNYHGRFEFASLNQMKTSVKIIKNIVKI